MTPILLAAQEVPLTDAEAAAIAGLVGIIMILALIISVISIVSMWKVFTKAGVEGWWSLIPIGNTIKLGEISGHGIGFVLQLLIPIWNIYIAFVLITDLAKSFGKDTLYGLGLAFLPIVFWPMLAFGESQYVGPAGPDPRPGHAPTAQVSQPATPAQGQAAPGWSTQGQQTPPPPTQGTTPPLPPTQDGTTPPPPPA